jgi:hypothetical protein
MRKPKANLYLRFRDPNGKQSPYCPAEYNSESRLRPFWCLVRGVPEHHPEATYYQRVKFDGKWKWESLVLILPRRPARLLLIFPYQVDVRQRSNPNRSRRSPLPTKMHSG